MNGGGLCWCYDFFESLDDFASYNIWTMLPRLIGRFNVRVGGSLDILRGFRRGFLGQGPKFESNLELLGRQAGACLHLHPFPLHWTGRSILAPSFKYFNLQNHPNSKKSWHHHYLPPFIRQLSSQVFATNSIQKYKFNQRHLETGYLRLKNRKPAGPRLKRHQNPES